MKEWIWPILGNTHTPDNILSSFLFHHSFFMNTTAKILLVGGLGASTLFASSVYAFPGFSGENGEAARSEFSQLENRRGADMARGSRGGHGMHGPSGHLEREIMQTLVDHEVSVLENGFSVTVTSDVEEIADIIIAREENASEREAPENVERTVEVLSNGIRMTVTSDDSETASRLVERAERMIEREERMQERRDSESA